MNYRRIKKYTQKFEARKRMFKSTPDESNILIKNNRRSTLTNYQLEFFCESDIFTDEITDESSELSNYSDELKIMQQSLLINSDYPKWNRQKLSSSYLE